MPDTAFNEFESTCMKRIYPFYAESEIVSNEGSPLPDGLFVDAVLYPSSAETCELSSIECFDRRCTVKVLNGETTISGYFTDESSSVELFDDNWVHRGTIVLGTDKSEFLGAPSSNTYSGVYFCTSCQFFVPANRVSSLTVGNNRLTGDIMFNKSENTYAVTTRTRKRTDGEYDLMFDVTGSSGISMLKPGLPSATKHAATIEAPALKSVATTSLAFNFVGPIIVAV